MQREPLKDRALNRWHGILPALGIPAKALTNRHGPCPMCGGKDRFRFDNKGGRGTWICSHCGAGDGIELVKQFKGCDFKEAAGLIEQHIGAAPIIVRRQAAWPTASTNSQPDEMIALWTRRAKPIQPDDIAAAICSANRPDKLPAVSAVRTGRAVHRSRPACDVASDDGGQGGPLGRGSRRASAPPCIGPISISGKADVRAPRKMMGIMPSGAAVRLAPHTDVLGIAEGIETALSRRDLFGVPTWAALTAGLLERMDAAEGRYERSTCSVTMTSAAPARLRPMRLRTG